jgi:hypothetical protein
MRTTSTVPSAKSLSLSSVSIVISASPVTQETGKNTSIAKNVRDVPKVLGLIVEPASAVTCEMSVKYSSQSSGN